MPLNKYFINPGIKTYFNTNMCIRILKSTGTTTLHEPGSYNRKNT